MAGSAQPSPSYDAFISYSHKDLIFAKWLEEQLERYEPPGGIGTEYRRLKIFRDEHDILVAHDLTGELRRHIQLSRYLIVVCSPGARKSSHVQMEIEEFAATHGPEKILCALRSGHPNSDVVPGAALQDQAFPDAVIQKGREPAAADFRPQLKETFWRRRSREHEAKLQILAVLLGVQKDDLARREEERRRRRRRRIVFAICTIFALLLAVGFGFEFTAAGQIYQIRRLAHSYISYGRIDGDGRRELALADIRWGYDRDAEQVLTGIFDPVEKVKAWTTAAQEWLAVGRSEYATRAIKSAFKAYREVSRREERIDCLILIAIADAKVTDIESAEEFLQIASDDTRFLDSNESIAKRIAISKAYRTIGDPDAADEMLEDAQKYITPLEPSEAKSVAMRDLAIAFAKLGRFESAKIVAEQISDPFQKALSLAQLASALAQTQKVEEAAFILDKATRLSRQISDGYYSGRAESEIAKQYIKIGRFSDAEKVAQPIPDDGERVSVALTLCDAGAVAECRKLVRHPPVSEADSWIEAHVAPALARAGDLQRAQEIASNNPDPQIRSEPDFADFALSEVGKIMVEQGKTAEAAALAAKINDAYRKAAILAAAAYFYAKSGQAQQFNQTQAQVTAVVPQISDPSRKMEILSTLGEAALLQRRKRDAASYLSQAAEAAVQIHDDLPRSEALKKLITLALDNSMLRTAKQLAELQTVDSRKVESFGQVLSFWKTHHPGLGLVQVVSF